MASSAARSYVARLVNGGERKTYEVARLRLARMSASGGNALARPVAEACELASNTLNVERVGIWLFVDRRRAIRCFHLFERSHATHSEGVLLHQADIPSYFRALGERSSISADDARTDPNTHELAPAYLGPLGITSMLDVPIYFGGEVRGVVCHEHTGKRRRWTPDERAFACNVADKLAMLGEEALRRDAERRALELGEQAVEAERMKAVAHVAAGAAHDVRSLIMAMRWAARAIVEDDAATDTVANHAERILSAADSVILIMRDLESVGGESQHAPEIFHAGSELARLLPVICAAAGACTVDLHTTGTRGLLLMDKGQLERLVLNLIVNARDAMPAGGTITIEVGEAKVEDQDVAPGVFTTISVRDTGVGMSAEVRARAFEPFFTTKRRGAGSGLGLAVVHSIVERYGGFVLVDSELGRGTTVRAYLPRVSGADRLPAG